MSFIEQSLPLFADKILRIKEAMMNPLKIFVLILLSFVSYPMQVQGQDQWQEEIKNTPYQSDYDATFIITGKNKTHSLTVDAKGCKKFDTQCIWQDVRPWIGIALDELHAQKATEESNEISGSRCTLTYSVYQEKPENILFQCQNGRKIEVYYTQIKKFLIKEFQ